MLKAVPISLTLEILSGKTISRIDDSFTEVLILVDTGNQSWLSGICASDVVFCKRAFQD